MGSDSIDSIRARGADLTNWNLTQATGISAHGATIVGNGGFGVNATAWLAHLPPDKIFANGFDG